MLGSGVWSVTGGRQFGRAGPCHAACDTNRVASHADMNPCGAHRVSKDGRPSEDRREPNLGLHAGVHFHSHTPCLPVTGIERVDDQPVVDLSGFEDVCDRVEYWRAVFRWVFSHCRSALSVHLSIR